MSTDTMKPQRTVLRDDRKQGPDVRPPTVTEAADWLKKMEHSPEYCRACLAHWKRVMGVSAAKQVFEQAPESVQRWINEKCGK